MSARRRTPSPRAPRAPRPPTGPPLPESEQWLRAILESHPECVKVLAPDGTLLDINPSGLRMLEADALERVRGRPLSDLVAPEHRAAFEALIARVLDGGIGVLEFEIVGLKGTRRRLETHAVPLRDADQAVTAVLSLTRDVTARHLIAADTERTLSLLTATLDATADGILVVDLDGRITAHNQRFVQMWGLPDSIVRSGLDDEAIRYVLGQLKDPAGFQAKIRDLYARPEAESYDVLEFRDGRMYERLSHPQRIDGRPVGRVWSFRDVSARHRAERGQQAAYRISRATLEAGSLADLLRALHEIVGELMPAVNFYVALYDDASGLLTFPYFVDEREPAIASRPLGRGLTEYVLRTGEPLLATPEVHEDLIRRREADLIGEPSIDWLGVPLRVGEATIGVVAVQTYSPGVRYTEADKDLLTFVSSQIALAVARQRAEDALRRNEERYRTFIEQSTEGVSRIEHDPPVDVALPEDEQIDALYRTGRIAECNDAMAQMYGYARAADLVGRAIADLHDRTDPANREFLRAFISSRYRLTDAESHERDREGRTRYFLNNSVGFVEHGRLARVWGTQRDITDQKRLGEQLRQAQKMEAVGQLAGGIAHDFNNILTAILGTCQLLLRDMRDEDPLRPDVLEIRTAALRAADLTRQLLAYGRRQLLAPKVLDLNAVVRGLEPMLRRLLGEDVELVTAPSPALWSTRADPGQIEQVIVNLAVNARDAMPGGGRLTIETANVTLDGTYVHAHPGAIAGPHVALVVRDTGVGMDAEVRRHLFEPFYTTKEVGRGTGLGLATVYGIVKQSGGYIAVDSEPGRGAAFHLYFPRVVGTPDLPAAELPRPAPGAETLLLVEDEDAVRTLASRTLRGAGYHVLTAAAGAAALRIARAHDGPIHLLVSDIVMPGMSGGELAERLVAERPDTSVLFISGYPGNPEGGRASLPGGATLLQKPFTPEELARAVRDLLDRRRADASGGAPPPPLSSPA